MKKWEGNYKAEHSNYNLTVNIGELIPSYILSNKVILITGASKGIGYSIAKKCINQGAKVIITGRNFQNLEQCKARLGENCSYLSFDMRDISVFDTILEKATKFYGNINCLVNNAGISLHEGSFMNVSEKSWDEQMETNLKAPYFLTQAWIRYYEKHTILNGKILMIASDTSGMGSTLPYGISKAAISSFTRGLAKHVIKKGIRINAIAPGTTKTEMTDDLTKGEIVRDTTAGNRVLFPEEIAELCIFLLSDASACISGNIFGCTEANICFDNIADNLTCETETNP